MRRVFNGTSRDGAGNIISSATVALYEAGGTTAATFYSSATSTTGINSTTSGTDGSFSIYVDNFDYDAEQTFKITISKTGFTTKSYDNIRLDDVVLGTYTISADKTVTTNLVVPKGVVYSVASGKTLTLNGTLDAGLYQIFTGSGTVSFGVKITQSYPEWFGTNTTPGTTDMTTPLQNSITALSAGGTVKLITTTYAFTYLTISTANTTLEGEGWGSVLQTSASPSVESATILRVLGDNVTLRNFKMTWKTMPSSQDALSTSIEKNDTIGIGYVTTATKILNPIVENVYVYGAKQHGISIGYSDNAQIINNRVEEVYGTGIFPYNTQNIRITGNFIYRTMDAAIDLQSGTGAYCDNATISNNIISGAAIGVGSHGGRNVTISGNAIDWTWGGAIYCQESSYWGVEAPHVTTITGNAIRRPFQFYGAGNFHATDRYSTSAGAYNIIEVYSTSEVVISSNVINDDSELYNYGGIYAAGSNVSITGNSANIDGLCMLYLTPIVVTDYTNILSLTVTGNNFTLPSGNGSSCITLNGVATGVISGNYFDCGGQALSSPSGRFLISEWSKDVLVTGNRIVNYTDLYTNNGNSSNIVFKNNIGAYDIPTSWPTAKTDTATLTVAEVLTGIISATPTAAATYTLDTGTLFDANGYFALYQWFDWTIINLASAAADRIITVAGDTGHTIVGLATVAANHSTTGALHGSSGRFRTQKTAANTFITYRIG